VTQLTEEQEEELLDRLLGGNPANELEALAVKAIQHFNREFPTPRTQEMLGLRDAMAVLIVEGTIHYDPVKGTFKRVFRA
jgi:hypothetical protein